MVKSNYKAWHINPYEFSDDWRDTKKLRFFAKYAVLSPSGHNTQPWRFNFGKQALQLKADAGRHLAYSGMRAAEPHVSLGACLETLQLAAKGFGYELIIKYDFEGDLVASIQLGKKTTADPTLLEAIVSRVSNRSFYETKSLPMRLLKEVTQTNLNDVATYLISNRKDISFIAEETGLATLTIMGDPKFRSELSKWVRNNKTRKYDGMPGFTQGIPTPPSMIARHIMKRFNVSKTQAKKDATRAMHSANLIIILVKNKSEEAYLNAGRLYAHICILAQKHGIATAGVGAAVIEPEAKQKVKKYFKLKYLPAAIVRLGKTRRNARHTPRWPLEKVASYDT